MLPLWTDRLRIYLHPDMVVLVRMTGVLRKSVRRKLAIPVELTTATPWKPALEVLNATLQQAEWQGALTTKILLASSLVHYRLAPWDARMTDQERLALLRHQFVELHGEALRASRIVLADTGFEHPGIACAVDEALLLELRTLSKTHHLRLTSVRPVLTYAFNAWRQSLRGGGWFLFVEQSHLTLALFNDGQWVHLRTHKVTDNWELGLEQILAREALQAGLNDAALPLHFYWPARPGWMPALQTASASHRLTLPLIQGYNPQTDREYGVALCR